LKREDVPFIPSKALLACVAAWLTLAGLAAVGCHKAPSESAGLGAQDPGSPEQTQETAAIPSLTKEQMYEDFDYLIALVREAYPRRVFKGKLLGFDMLDELGKLRGEIEGLSTTEDFVLLVDRGLTLTQDAHTSMRWAAWAYDQCAGYWDVYKAHGSEEAKRMTRLYADLLESIDDEVQLWLPVLYYQGDYLVYADFEHKGTHCPRGARLVRVNGEDVDTAVSKLFDQVLLQWDAGRKKAFATLFYRARKYRLAGSVDLEFVDASGAVLRGTFSPTDTVDFERPPHKPAQGEKRVLYFPQHNLLYIRVPRMETDDATLDHYRTQITKIGQASVVDKVAIDIRGNPGGGDGCWQTLVGMLIAKPVQAECRVALKESELNADYIQARIYSRIEESRPKTETFPYLDGETLLIGLDKAIEVEPDEDSIRYTGIVYVLQDEGIFSSAGSFSCFANALEGFATVGARPNESGVGIDPFIFSLPHSKLMFLMGSSLDISNATQVEDLLHSDVEVPVEIPFDERIERMYTEQDLYSEEYLLNNDSVFRKVLELPGQSQTAPRDTSDVQEPSG